VRHNFLGPARDDTNPAALVQKLDGNVAVSRHCATVAQERDSLDELAMKKTARRMAGDGLGMQHAHWNVRGVEGV
jgi:hypothetical protein